jgi:predicted metal-binding protein
MEAGKDRKKRIDEIVRAHGYNDYKWIDPREIVVAQWVRMKCMFGCREYGHGGACPPNTLSIAECERFFKEYSDAIILHFEGTMDKPEDRHTDFEKKWKS